MNVNYYESFGGAVDTTDLIRRIDCAVQALGFCDFVFLWPVNTGFDTQWLTALPIELVVGYFAEELHLNDPALQYAEYSTRPVCLSSLYDPIAQLNIDIPLVRTVATLYQLNKSFGYYDFFLVPCRTVAGEGNVLLSVTARRRNGREFKRLVARSKGQLVHLCEAIDQVLVEQSSALSGLKTINKRTIAKIQPKALQALDLLANNDFKHQQIAEKMCVAPATVNDHLASARKAIGVSNSHMAIKYAVVNGLIDYEY